MAKPTNHEAYLSELQPEQRTALEQLRRIISRVAPDAVEVISTNVPAYKYKGKYLVSMNVAKDHVGFLMMQGDVLKTVKPDVPGAIVTNVAIKFDPANPPSEELVERLVKLRMAEIKEQS